MRPSARRFTGWHMTAILTAFFGVVIGVNLMMARMAIATFGGTVVDNSYVASQKYNGWLEQARVQDRLGWKVAAGLDRDRRLTVTVAGPDGPLADGMVTAVVRHPLGQAPERALAMSALRAGRARSADAVPAGRWLADVTIRRGDAVHRSMVELR